MKHIFITLLFGLITLSLSAQTGTSRAQKKADRIVKKLDQSLNLNASQEASIKAAYLSESEGMPTRNAGNSAAANQKMKANFIARIEPLMTAAQTANFNKFKTRFLGQ